MDAEEILGFAVSFVVAVLLCVMCVQFYKRARVPPCCQCRGLCDFFKAEDDSNDISDTLPAVKLRRDFSFADKANTWPWRDPKRSRRHKDKRDSGIIFNTNSLCIQIVADGDEEDPAIDVNELQFDEGRSQHLRYGGAVSVQSIMSNFEEDIMRSIGALDLEPGLSDSVNDARGSIGGTPLYQEPVSVVEMMDEARNDDAISLVSFEDVTDVESEVFEDVVSVDSGDNSSNAPVPLRNRPIMSMRRRCYYSLARDEILCCSSNASSLTLESPWLSNIGCEDLHASFTSSLLQEPQGSSLLPFMLYRYSISLEEIHFPPHLAGGIPTLLLPPLSMTSLLDEDEVFYDARSTLCSTHSSLIDHAGVSLCPWEVNEHLNSHVVARDRLRRSVLFSTLTNSSTHTVRRYSSL